MEKRLMTLLTLLFVGIGLMTAQTRKVTGTVLSDEDGLPVIGASVLVKGTSMGTVTDMDGIFVINNIPESATTLVVSYIGMKAQDVKIQANVRVVLLPDTELLEEVVVVGYGTAKKVGTVIGTLTTVGSEKLEAKPTANVFDGLQGQVPGLQIFTSSGEPNASSSVLLRGVGSLTAGNEPLYILDGTPVTSNVMTTMNPNDFESITVLKDASATSIYGSRAANGVIFMTSKKGKMGDKASVTVSSSYGLSNLARRVGDPMNAQELLDYQLLNGMIKKENYDKFSASGVNTNWERYMFKRNRPTYNTNVSVQGGSDKTRFFLSGSYYFKDGLTPNSEYTRYTFRSNIETTVNDWLKVGTNIGLSYDRSQTALFTYQGSNSLNGGILAVSMNEPYYSPYAADGSRLEYIPGINGYDPEYLASKNPRKGNKAILNNSTFVQITPINGLTIRSQFGLEAYDSRSTTKVLSSHPSAKGKGSSSESMGRDANLSITNTAEYKLDINKIHGLTFLVGQEGIRNQYNWFRSKTEGQNDDRLPELGSGTTATFLGGSDGFVKYKSSYLSYFGRIDYSLMDKYYADFSVRNDASSRFGKDNRNATFYSGGLMWNMKKEDWLKNVSAISSLQLKGSIGSTGNSAIGNYDHLALVGTANYDGTGWIVNSPGNSKLGWETQILSNIGADVTFLDKYSFGLTYYHRKTKDMLMDVPLPGTSGFGTYTANVGAMTNQGVELLANIDIFRNRDWYVNFSANYAYNKNKITKLFSGLTEWPMPSYNMMYKVGSPVEYYMPIFAGVDPADGLQMWKIPGTNETTKDKDLAGSGALNQATGNKRYAPHSGGFSLSAGWKGIAFVADFSWVLGKYMVNNDRYFSENPANFAGYNQAKVVQTEWREPGDITSMPKFGEVMIFDTHLLENASFLRLKNIGVSYVLPKELLAKTHFFKSVKFMVNARNLLTATAYKGADPELNSNLSFGAYPNTREFSFGTEITF